MKKSNQELLDIILNHTSIINQKDALISLLQRVVDFEDINGADFYVSLLIKEIKAL